MIGDVTSTCQIVSARPEFVGKHGYLCAPGISRQSVGARGINLQIAIIPPGALAKAHKHDGHETALHILSGEAGIWYGEKLEHHLIARAGDFLYIPPNTPHLPYNLSGIETCVAIIARTDPDDQEDVVLLPELESSDSYCCSKWRGLMSEKEELEFLPSPTSDRTKILLLLRTTSAYRRKRRINRRTKVGAVGLSALCHKQTSHQE